MASTEASKDHGVHLEAVEDSRQDAKLSQHPVVENRAEKEKELLRKIDLRMMPLMMLICKATPLEQKESQISRLPASVLGYPTNYFQPKKTKMS